jgi:hypothetical protein
MYVQDLHETGGLEHLRHVLVIGEEAIGIERLRHVIVIGE